MEKIELRIGYNNNRTEESCELCNVLFETQVPIELFIKDTMFVVCRQCGKKYAPILTALLDNHYPEI